MKFALSTIAVGVALACVCHAASAQSLPTTVNVTQQGNRNTAYAEQVGLSLTLPTDALGVSATIIQIGDHNHAGGPGSMTGGIIQRAPSINTSALIHQNGRENDAGITQDRMIGSRGENESRITQLGSGNKAMLKQDLITSSLATIEQSGTLNLARVEQINSSDTNIQTRQSGNGNRIAIRQDRGIFGGPNITQNGNGNAVSTVSENVLGSGPLIFQIGDMNIANTVQTNTESALSIGQQGFGNRTDVAQADGIGDSTTIHQGGNNNRASVSQRGENLVSQNHVWIAQVGNDNSATVRQLGQRYVANVSQTGSGNYTSIYQH